MNQNKKLNEIKEKQKKIKTKDEFTKLNQTDIKEQPLSPILKKLNEKFPLGGKPVIIKSNSNPNEVKLNTKVFFNKIGNVSYIKTKSFDLN